jgi:hypothetical protein
VILGAGGNTTVFVTAGGVVLVDTKLPNNGEAILNQVRTVSDKPARKPGWGRRRRRRRRGLKPTFPVFTKDDLLTDMEYGGTPLSRAVINVNLTFQELGKR